MPIYPGSNIRSLLRPQRHDLLCTSASSTEGKAMRLAYIGRSQRASIITNCASKLTLAKKASTPKASTSLGHILTSAPTDSYYPLSSFSCHIGCKPLPYFPLYSSRKDGPKSWIMKRLYMLRNSPGILFPTTTRHRYVGQLPPHWPYLLSPLPSRPTRPATQSPGMPNVWSCNLPPRKDEFFLLSFGSQPCSYLSVSNPR